MPRKPAPLPDNDALPPEKAAKSTDAEVRRRVNTVYKLILHGQSRGAIVQYAAREWGVSQRSADSYVKKARDLLAESGAEDRDTERGIAVERLNGIYMDAFSAPVRNHWVMLAAIKELNVIHGVYAPTKTEQTGKNGGPLEIVIRRSADYAPPPVIHEGADAASDD